jgi:hypothetical protein
MVKYRKFVPAVLALSGLLSLPMSVGAQAARADTSDPVVPTGTSVPTPPQPLGMIPHVKPWCC